MTRDYSKTLGYYEGQCGVSTPQTQEQTTPSTTWEDELTRIANSIEYHSQDCCVYWQDRKLPKIKTFIQTQIDKAKAEARAEAREETIHELARLARCADCYNMIKCQAKSKQQHV